MTGDVDRKKPREFEVLDADIGVAEQIGFVFDDFQHVVADVAIIEEALGTSGQAVAHRSSMPRSRPAIRGADQAGELVGGNRA